MMIHVVVFPVSRRLASSARVVLPLAVAAALAGLFVPLGYDEALWLAVAKRVEEGARLYDTVIDNKTPVVYVAAWLIDLLPASFVMARAVVVAGLAVLIAGAVMRLTRSALQPVRYGTAVVVVLSALLHAELQLSTELVALSLVLAALAWADRRHAVTLTVLALGAVAFDLRAALLLPGLVMLIGHSSTAAKRRQVAWLTASGLAVGLLLALALPDLRYGLIELNLATRPVRGGWRVLDQAVVLIRSLLPVAVWLMLTRPDWRRVPQGAWALLVGAAIIGLGSLHAIDHYWAYPLAVTPYLVQVSAPARRPSMSLAGAAVVALAALPILADVIAVNNNGAQVMQSYERAADLLNKALADGDTFLVFSAKPHLTALLPEHAGLRSPVAQYLTWSTNRTPVHMGELPTLIDRAEAIVDEGGLSIPVERLYPDQRAFAETFLEHVDEFPCIRTVEHLTILFRRQACPEGS